MQDNNALAQELDTIIDQAIGDAEDHITMSFDTAEAILAALRTAGEVGHKRDHGPSCCCAHCQLDAWKDEQSERQATVGQEVARIAELEAALRKIGTWCRPLLCINCADNRELARATLRSIPEND